MIRYIIVDDETAAHDNIQEFSQEITDLVLVKHCYNAFEAIECLNQEDVDLIFLDINMPKLSGFDFLRTLTNPPKIIVTTAYKEFAIEGYELNISDYLLKPFSIQRFISAVNKIKEQLANVPHSETIKNISSDTLFIKVNKKHIQVQVAQILMAKAFGNYVKVHLMNEVIMVHQSLASFEASLPTGMFLKVHKSFVIAKNKITLIEGNRIFLSDIEVPIGKQYRMNVDQLLS